MASSPAKIRALIGPVLLLQTATARQDPAVVIVNISCLTAVGDFKDEASVGGLIKKRQFNAELKCQCMEQRTQDIQALPDRATQEGQTQTADPPQRLDR